MANKSSGIFLDIDPTITEKNLRFATNSAEDDFSRMFKPPEDNCPSKLITPLPGFCIKTREVGEGTKCFINICYTDAIPPPKNISERELQDILESDEPSSFRVPMSIGDIRPETDNGGNEAKVCDVAVHSDFFKKVEHSTLFKSFLVTLVFEGIQNKHGIFTTDDKIILKNKKAYGKLQVHRIRQREIEEKIKSVQTNLIEEIRTSSKDVKTNLIEPIENVMETPEYRLFRRRVQPNLLIGEFKFPKIINGAELKLDLGQDRILIESANYFLDIFIPHIIRETSATATFDKATKILTITMPLIGG